MESAGKKIAGLGEVLWDVFPDGPRFGGAPANFACSAAGVGGDGFRVLMVSSVGHDELGDRAIEELSRRHVDVMCLQRAEQITGRVIVTLDPQGKATYEFAQDTAWDNLQWTPQLAALAPELDAVCFGTLGQRSLVSGQTIRRFVSATKPTCLRILDINLRAPYWDEQTILSSLPLAGVLKLNDEELPVIASLLSLQGTPAELLDQLRSKYSLRLVALTRGAAGSLLLDEHGQFSDDPGKSVQVVDTVGAGDAFTAALAIGMLRGEPLGTLHSRAATLAAFVCTQPGAAPKIPATLRFT